MRDGSSEGSGRRGREGIGVKQSSLTLEPDINSLNRCDIIIKLAVGSLFSLLQ